MFVVGLVLGSGLRFSVSARVRVKVGVRARIGVTGGVSVSVMVWFKSSINVRFRGQG